MSIGKKIKEFREEVGLTQKELGEKVHVSESAIGNYETGKRSPSIELLKAIADVLNVSLDDFFEENEQPLNPLTLGEDFVENLPFLENEIKNRKKGTAAYILTQTHTAFSFIGRALHNKIIKEREKIEKERPYEDGSKAYKFLIADDDPLYREELSDLLTEEFDCKIYTVDNPKDVVNEYQKHLKSSQPVDIVFLDRFFYDQKEHKDGLEVLQQLKSCNPDVIVIMHHTNWTEKRAMDVLQAGANYAFFKPFTPHREMLIEKVKSFSVKKETS